MDEITIPELPDCMIRHDALAMACEFADTWQEAMAIADSFVEYIEGNASSFRFTITAND